jgi:hypothetical protein
MDSAFEAIGMDVPNRAAFNSLAERAGSYGEATQAIKQNYTWHGRCWKLGSGLEIWTVLYQSNVGEVFYADCRPGFRSRFAQKISPWALTEYDEAGEALLHGYLENSNTEVLLEVQNLTEIYALNRYKTINVGLCGLAYGAWIESSATNTFWQPQANSERENDWTLCGRVLMCRMLKNPLTGCNLFWLYLDIKSLRLEVLVNQRSLRGGHPTIGANVRADVWLQGYIFNSRVQAAHYEGIDAKAKRAGFWRQLRRVN